MSKKKRKGSGQRYDVMGAFSPDDVLPHITRGRTRRDYTGDDGRVWSVKMNSHRYWTFRESLKCVVCGLEGTVMSLERGKSDTGQPHFNLYAVLPSGKRVLLTKDHIEPRSKGGQDAGPNFQTMCTVCNGLKSNYRLTLEQVQRLRLAANELAGSQLPEVPKGTVRLVLDRLAERMSSADWGDAPMTAGELAAMLLRNPDAVVSIGEPGTGRDPIRSIAQATRGVLDSDALPEQFLVLTATAPQ